MSLAADRWPVYRKPTDITGRRRLGFAVVWRWELAKLAAQIRVRVMAALCLVVPFLVVAVFKLQSVVPQDTLFGQWVHSSGFAVPLVILGFTGQWVLPLLTAIVSGDIFSSEDHFGTWKTVLTRSRSRGEIFLGKLTAALTYTLTMFVLLAGASLLAGTWIGTQPLVNLSGQLVIAGHAAKLIVASWATQVAPLLAFCAIAVLLSIASRSSVIGIGGAVLLGLILQLGTLVNMPEAVRAGLVSTPFASWHGLWLERPFYGPLREGLLTSAAWFISCTDLAWVIFRLRDIGTAP